MASVVRDLNGRKRIQFTDESGIRRTVRLGKCSQRAAKDVRDKLEALLGSLSLGMPVEPDVRRWLDSLSNDFYRRLVAAGLAPSRESKAPLTLGELCDQYVSGRSDVRERTRFVYRHSVQSLLEFFGAGKLLADLTEADGEGWSRYLTEKGLALATARKRTQVVKQILDNAVKRRILPANPFAALKSASVANPSRQFFVDRATAERVLAACPDAEWRCLFALARFGGLRIPTEALALTWADVDLGERRILVHSPKTARHVGKGERWIPLFPELAGPLQECFDQAPEGAVCVIRRRRKSNVNLRTEFGRIVQRAGLTIWEKPFQNCRATRATELAETYPAHVVAAWMGHSERIAERHYLQATSEHFAKAAQNAAHYLAVPSRNDRKVTSTDAQENADFPVCTATYHNVQPNPLRPTGFEPVTPGLGNRCSILLSYGRIRGNYYTVPTRPPSMLRRGGRSWASCLAGTILQAVRCPKHSVLLSGVYSDGVVRYLSPRRGDRQPLDVLLSSDSPLISPERAV